LPLWVLFSSTRIYESREEEYSLMTASDYTIPVSIILPAKNERIWIKDSLGAILNLDYPNYEVVVVNDGSTDNTMDILNEMLELKAIDMVYPDRFSHGKIHEVYKSGKHPNVTVISEESGFKKAGAVNAGLNFARYEFICAMDADTILEPDALLKVMAHVERDPERVVGVGSYFGLVNGFNVKDGKILKKTFSFNPLIAYQNLEYLRNFIGNRISWSAVNAVPNISGGFGVWRKDLVMGLGGYETGFSSEDIELTFHAQDLIVKSKKDYKILALPYSIGWTEGPGTISSLISQRQRWQRVIDETLWRYKHMILNPRYKWFAFLTLPYYLVYESLGVFIELASIGILLFAWLAGILQLKIFLTYFAMMILAEAVISLLVLVEFFRDQKLFKPGYALYLVVLSYFEIFLYRWIILIAKIKGTFGFFRGDTQYEMYKRVDTRSR
jgi:biofilm PGA synthesis N-glycosyltransferase PgaC